ncbi:MAG: glycosyltransferase family 9 protein [Thermomicrobiales bacterium]
MTKRQPQRIAVFQAAQLGDLICATPALRALREGYPQAEITLIGSVWGQGLAARLPMLDSFIPFPGFPGIRESPAVLPAEPPVWPPFDLAIQMHGSGDVSNGFITTLGAAQTLGHALPGDTRLDIARAWEPTEAEPRRWLGLVTELGIPAAGLQLEFPFTHEERDTAARLIDATADEAVIGVHVGASELPKRWPPEAFAQVIDGLAETLPARFVLTGAASEAELTARTAAAAHTPVIDLGGQTTLGEFAAAIAGLDLLLTNDTGASHLAAVYGTPSVVLFGHTDPRRWAPLDAERHRVIAASVVCGEPDGARALQMLPPDAVLAHCREMLHDSYIRNRRNREAIA